MAKENPAFMKPWKISPELAAVIGEGPMPRPQVVSKLWVYIKANNLQDPKNKREILLDEKLKKIFPGSSVNMLKMQGFISKHLS